MASQAGGILLCKTFSAVSFSDQTKMSFSFFSFFRPAGEEWVRRGSSATFSSSTDRLLYIHWEMGKRMNSARLTEHRNLRMRRGPCQWFTDFQSIVWRWICLCRERERKKKRRPVCYTVLIIQVFTSYLREKTRPSPRSRRTTWPAIWWRWAPTRSSSGPFHNRTASPSIRAPAVERDFGWKTCRQ